MRGMLIATASGLILSAALASIASAQTLDRYGGQASYSPPAGVRPAPTRVLTWAGKTEPQSQAQPAPARPAAWGAYPSIQGAYAPQGPSAYPVQPQAGAPQPIPRPPQPQGQPIAVAPQAFYPPQVLYYPGAYQTLTGQPSPVAPPTPPVQSQFLPAPSAPAQASPAQAAPVQAAPAQPSQGLPSSIYDPPRPLAAAAGAQPTQLAALDAPQPARAPAGQGVRTYSIHRPFGKTPDPVATPPSGFDSAVLLAPAEDDPDTLKGEGLGLHTLADAKD